MIHILVEEGDIADQKSDVMILKFAERLHGADRYISDREGFVPTISEGQSEAIKSRNTSASTILFVGVGNLLDFGYDKIRDFARNGIILALRANPAAKTVTMTAHGPGYGLDEKQAFVSMLFGLRDGLANVVGGPKIDGIIIVEKNRKRVERYRKIVEVLGFDLIEAPKLNLHHPVADRRVVFTDTTVTLPRKKGSLFLAMPFADKFEDEHSAIREACEALDVLCERIDTDIFQGDIVNKIKEKIDKCDMFVALLNDNNPNVFLELGYAWGKSKKTILIVDNADSLPFDVKTQNTIIYKSRFKLREDLKKVLADTLSSRVVQ